MQSPTVMATAVLRGRGSLAEAMGTMLYVSEESTHTANGESVQLNASYTTPASIIQTSL
jgi:hypothetical protein